MPRPSKFTEPVKQQILAVLKVGGDRKTAAQVAGVHEDTLGVWLREGREAELENDPRAIFYREVLAAEAAPKFKALGILDREMENNPMLAWKTVERRVPGYAPPMPGTGQAAPAVTINLSLTGSAAPLPNWIEGEVVEDAEESPALPAGDGPVESPES